MGKSRIFPALLVIYIIKYFNILKYNCSPIQHLKPKVFSTMKSNYNVLNGYIIFTLVLLRMNKLFVAAAHQSWSNLWFFILPLFLVSNMPSLVSWKYCTCTKTPLYIRYNVMWFVLVRIENNVSLPLFNNWIFYFIFPPSSPPRSYYLLFHLPKSIQL